MTGPILRALPGLGTALAHPAFEDGADVVVVGTGAAGMSAALEASSAGLDVLVISKAGVGGGSTPWAQGGLAAALDPSDSAACHAADTITAAVGLGEPSAIDILVGAAPAEIARLTALGAHFDPGPLGLEGGHSRHRIVHAGGDASGAEVHRVLAGALLAEVVRADLVRAGVVRAAAPGPALPRLRLMEHTVALDAILDDAGRVVGLFVGRIGPEGGALTVGVIRTAALVLATGGLGHAFATTSNPEGVTGDGLALAARAGAEVRDVEFVQFHPTVLWRRDGRGRRPLITEALRGAGATLVDRDGRSVMAGAHPLGDLAPRDVVSATMHRRMTTGDGPTTHLWLDATSVGAGRLEEKFPTVTAACRQAGIDPAIEPIPVAPGAHYACGGVAADMDGTTSVDGLFAVGEVASTGVHGANRLASNSLTESLAAGRRVGRLLVEMDRPGSRSVPIGTDLAAAAVGVDPAARDGLADAMSAHAGVVRHGEGLEHLLGLLAAASAAPGPLDLETVEATNLHTVSTLVAVAALARTESRGCHRRSDFPHPDPVWLHRLTLRVDDGRVEVAVGADR